MIHNHGLSELQLDAQISEQCAKNSWTARPVIVGSHDLWQGINFQFEVLNTESNGVKIK